MAQAIVESGCRLKLLIVRNGETEVPIPTHEFEDVTQIDPSKVQTGGIDSL